MVSRTDNISLIHLYTASIAREMAFDDVVTSYTNMRDIITMRHVYPSTPLKGSDGMERELHILCVCLCIDTYKRDVRCRIQILGDTIGVFNLFWCMRIWLRCYWNNYVICIIYVGEADGNLHTPSKQNCLFMVTKLDLSDFKINRLRIIVDMMPGLLNFKEIFWFLFKSNYFNEYKERHIWFC